MIGSRLMHLYVLNVVVFLILAFTPSSANAKEVSHPEVVPSRVGQAAVSVYLVASELTVRFQEQCIQPAIKFWRDQEAAALERKIKAKQQSEPLLDPYSEASKSETTPWKAEKGMEVEGLKRKHFVKKSQEITKPSQNLCDVTRGSKSKLAMVVLPSRLCRLSIIAWLLAETLDHFGILHEDTPEVLRSQVYRVWYELQPRLSELRYRLETIYYGHIAPAAVKTSKPPFAIGVATGMIASPLVTVAWQPMVVVVCLAELNARQKMKGRWHLENAFGHGLDRIRNRVRTLLPPIHGNDHGRMLMIKSGGSSKEKRKVWMFMTRNDIPSALSTSRECQQSDRFRELLKHGALVGSLLGLVMGL